MLFYKVNIECINVKANIGNIVNTENILIVEITRIIGH